MLPAPKWLPPSCPAGGLALNPSLPRSCFNAAWKAGSSMGAREETFPRRPRLFACVCVCTIQYFEHYHKKIYVTLVERPEQTCIDCTPSCMHPRTLQGLVKLQCKLPAWRGRPILKPPKQPNILSHTRLCMHTAHAWLIFAKFWTLDNYCIEMQHSKCWSIS